MYGFGGHCTALLQSSLRYGRIESPALKYTVYLKVELFFKVACCKNSIVHAEERNRDLKRVTETCIGKNYFLMV